MPCGRSVRGCPVKPVCDIYLVGLLDAQLCVLLPHSATTTCAAQTPAGLRSGHGTDSRLAFMGRTPPTVSDCVTGKRQRPSRTIRWHTTTLSMACMSPMGEWARSGAGPALFCTLSRPWVSRRRTPPSIDRRLFLQHAVHADTIRTARLANETRASGQLMRMSEMTGVPQRPGRSPTGTTDMGLSALRRGTITRTGECADLQAIVGRQTLSASPLRPGHGCQLLTSASCWHPGTPLPGKTFRCSRRT